MRRRHDGAARLQLFDSPKSVQPLILPSFTTPGERDDAVDELGLRDYQTTALRETIRLYLSGIERLLLTMPTGAGKTVVFVGLIRLIRRGILGRPLRTLVVVHRRELLRQAYKHLTGHGLARWPDRRRLSARSRRRSVGLLGADDHRPA
jgi:superfamily II DNA or RNA helicase